MGSSIHTKYPSRAIDLLLKLDEFFASGQFDPSKITKVWNPITGEVVDKETNNTE